MRVTRARHIVQGSLKTQSRDRLSDNFGRQWANGVHAKNLTVLLLRDHFDKSFMLSQDRRLSIADERKLPSLHLEARLAGLLFRQADGSDLRFAVGRVRAALAIERLHLFAGHGAHGGNSLHRSRVCKLWETS